MAIVLLLLILLLLFNFDNVVRCGIYYVYLLLGAISAGPVSQDFSSLLGKLMRYIAIITHLDIRYK